MVDHFHVIRLANAALDEVRRRTQQTTTGHRGHNHDPLYRIRRRLLAGHDRLDPAAFARMLAWLDAGDPEGDSASGSATSTTLASGSCCAAAPHGHIDPPHQYDPANHASARRAGIDGPWRVRSVQA